MSRRPKLLIDEPPLQVLPSLAAKIGLNEAMVLQQLHYLTQKEHGPPEFTLDELCDAHFQFWTTRTLQRATKELRRRGLLTTEQARGTDRRNRYVVEIDAVEALEEDASMTTDCRDGTRHDDVIEGDRSSPSKAPDRRDVIDERTTTAEPQRLEGEADASPSSGGPSANASGPPRRDARTADPSSLPSQARSEDKPGAAERNTNPKFGRLSELLADLIEGNGSRRPSGSQIESWRNDVRLMVEQDGRTPEQIEKAMRWAHKSSFWRANVLSMGKLRHQFDQLRLQAMREANPAHRVVDGGRRATTRDQAGWREWVSEHLPDLSDTLHHQAVFVAQQLDGGGHEVTVEALRARLLDRSAA